MRDAAPSLLRQSPFFVRVSGTFYRAIDVGVRARVLAGSNRPGRYSPPDTPTLYLSASRDGVEAAMIAHRTECTQEQVVCELDVRADAIFDLRDALACRSAGIDIADALAPWQEVAAAGATPDSWNVRRRVEALGASGLIDPSRKAPGLWHLVLFSWNRGGDAIVRLRP